MRIKKHGNTYKETGPKEHYEKFICDNCGCVFTAKDNEYYRDVGGERRNTITITYSICTPKDILACSCPECHKMIQKMVDGIEKAPWYYTTTSTSTPTSAINVFSNADSSSESKAQEPETYNLTFTCEKPLKFDEVIK